MNLNTEEGLTQRSQRIESKCMGQNRPVARWVNDFSHNFLHLFIPLRPSRPWREFQLIFLL